MAYITITENESEYIKKLLIIVRKVQLRAAYKMANTLTTDWFEIDKSKETSNYNN